MAHRHVDIEPFDELSREELYEILGLRCEVFVVGQGITQEPEIDGRDPECEHAMLWEDGELVGTARIFHREEPIVVGRVAVANQRQGSGLGTELMEAIQAHLGGRHTELHAQAHLEDWYTRLGWERVGDEFMEADIPHVMMRWTGPEDD